LLATKSENQFDLTDMELIQLKLQLNNKNWQHEKRVELQSKLLGEFTYIKNNR